MTAYSRIAVLVAAVAAMISLGACNTIEGIGKDTKSAGKAIEEAADDAKD